MSTVRPRGGVHYPRSAGEFRSCSAPMQTIWTIWTIRTGCAGRKASCARGVSGWAVADGGYRCASCGGRTSVTAGTIRRRLPVRVLRGPHVGHGGDDVRPPQDAADVWFEACWMFASGKDGMSR